MLHNKSTNKVLVNSYKFLFRPSKFCVAILIRHRLYFLQAEPSFGATLSLNNKFCAGLVN